VRRRRRLLTIDVPPRGSPDPHLGPLLAEAEARDCSGWNFAWLGGRLHTESPWDYTAMVLDLVGSSPDLLDMGTGGGEWLSALPTRSPRAVATEAWPPNLGVAAVNLRPFGVPVVRDEGAVDNLDQACSPPRGRLPFRSGSFHLIVNRHEAFNVAEVARVLDRGGFFVTQQVDRANFDDFYRLLGLDVPADASGSWLDVATEQARAAGLVVLGSGRGIEWHEFADVGAIAWYLRAVPWGVRDFTIAASRDRLALVHEQLCADGPARIRQTRFWLRAQQPG
jgi:hypothetical protein